MQYLITPSTWRSDEYRDVLSADEIANCLDVAAQIPTGDLDRGSPVYRSPTVAEAMAECDPLDAGTYAEACREAWATIGDDLSPECRPG